MQQEKKKTIARLDAKMRNRERYWKNKHNGKES